MVVLAMGLLASKCFIHPGGNPGNRRLNTLRSDPVFSALPPGAHLIKPIVLTPTRWTCDGFGWSQCGWNGISVSMYFHSNLPIAQVYAFYNARAEAAGWKPSATNGIGLIFHWEKDYPNRVAAELDLQYGGAAVAGPDTQGAYDLSASASAIR